MKIEAFRPLALVCVLVGHLMTGTAYAQALLNIDFGAINPSPKSGPAVVGQDGDFWNATAGQGVQSEGDSLTVIENLKFADTSDSGIDLEMAGFSFSDTISDCFDPMFATYAGDGAGGPVTVTLKNLPAGAYSLILYGHGKENDSLGEPLRDSFNSIFDVACGDISNLQRWTTTGPGWNQASWQEEVQYGTILA